MKRRSFQLAFGLLCLSAFFLLLPADASAQCNAAWTTNVFYGVGAKVSYASRNYTCQQGHTSQVGWEPPNVPALWTDNGACSGGATPTATSRPTATPTGATATPTTRPSSSPSPTLPPPPTPTSVAGINPGPGVPNGAGAPYVDVMAWPTLDVNTARAATGKRYYVFAFVQSYACEPRVGGVLPMSDLWYKDQLNALRAAGGDMILGFGGAAGIELAQACSDVTSLTNAYRAAINTYKATYIDLDIEGAPLFDTAANDRRNKAIKSLGVKIMYTLPTMPEGLTSGGTSLLANAKANGVAVNVVNVMAMDYGGAYCGDMGGYGVQAIGSVRSQVSAAGLTAGVGITPMIGVNDVTCEVFNLSDMDQVKGASPAFVSFWSLGRDNGGCAGCGCASPSCSGISQAAWDFTRKMP